MDRERERDRGGALEALSLIMADNKSSRTFLFLDLFHAFRTHILTILFFCILDLAFNASYSRIRSG